MTNDEIVLRATADFEEFWVDGVLRDEPVVKVYDLEERTARFGEAVIRFAKRIPFNPVNNRLIDQVVGAATSVAANYCEADDAVSKREFIVNINRCRKESRETKLVLRLIATAEPSLKPDARELWHEAKELNLIFSTIVRNARRAMVNDEARRTNGEPTVKPDATSPFPPVSRTLPKALNAT
jgi:four helix bundle protein